MRFTLKVFSESSGITALEFEATSAEDAFRMARNRGYVVLGEAGAARPKPLPATLGRPFRQQKFSLLLFSQHLLALLEAGFNLTEAIETLAEGETGREIQMTLQRLLDRLRGGESCSDAMAAMPDIFPSFFVATLRASEGGGDLAESLRRYVTYQAQIEFVRKRVISAMIYPTLLLVVGSLVTLFLLGYVVPKFSRIYEDRSADLPVLSQLLMEWGKAAETHGGPLFGSALVLFLACGWAASRPDLRTWLGQKLWSLPWLGERMRVYELARLYRTLSMLLRGGTPISTALGLVPGLLSPVLRGHVDQAVALIREGQPISAAMQTFGLTTPVAYRMLRVGERSGRMGEMMDRAAAFYDDEVARWLDVFAKVFEPAMMALIGAMVGGIVILMYLPIFELAGSLK